MRIFVTKPRIQYCRFSRVWIVNEDGGRHTCSAPGFTLESGWRSWTAAVEYANEIATVGLERELARRETNPWLQG